MAKKRTYKKGTATYTQAKRRKGFLSVALPWLKRFGMIGGVVILILWLGTWFVITGAASRTINWGKAQIIMATANAGLTVQNLYIEGRTYSDPVLLKALLNIQKGDPLLSISPRDAKTLLEETQWIRSAQVQRRLPDTLYIKLQERTPIAIWSKQDLPALLDENGDVITSENLENFDKLITVRGKNANTATPLLIATLSAVPLIALETKSATRYGERRWDITLKNGIILQMPEDENLSIALHRAANAQKDDKIFDNPDLQSVDLRFEDKIIIKTKPGAVIDYKAGRSSKTEGHI